MPLDRPAFRAGNSSIYPASFVKVDTAVTTGNAVAQAANAASPVIGVSHDGTVAAPVDSASQYAATGNASSGDSLDVHLLGETCLLRIGSGGCTVGDELVPSTNGTGVTAGAANNAQYIGAIALQSASNNELANVLVVCYLK